MLKKNLMVAIVVSSLYFVSNLTFVSALDDTVIFIAAEEHHSGASFLQMLRAMDILFKPATTDSASLYRPLRGAYSWLLVFAGKSVPWIPDLVSSLVAGGCALVLTHYYRSSALSASNSLLGTLWFFSCIPVVAMAQVVLVCQFVIIGGLYLVVGFFQRYLETRRPVFLLCSAGLIFLAGLYGEAMLIAAVAIGVLGVIALLRGQRRDALVAFAFAPVCAFLVLGNAFLLTWEPGQFVRGMRSVLCTRGYDVGGIDEATMVQRIGEMARNYLLVFRTQALTSIFFSVSPLLVFVALAAQSVAAVMNRRYLVLLVLGAAAIVAYWHPPAALGIGFAALCVAQVGRHPLLVSMFVGGMVVLGPIFVIDTHITYVLPAVIGLLFYAIGEGCGCLPSAARRPLLVGLVAVFALIGASNFVSGAYFSASIANDNRLLAQRMGEYVRKGVLLTNCRHAIDVYFYANFGRYYAEHEGELYFTATVPLWNEDRAVRDEQALQKCFATALAQNKPLYYLIVDHDRLPGKAAFHGPRFLGSTRYRFTLVDIHSFQATVPIFDPGFLLVNHFYNPKHRRSRPGFIGYPIFPDMIDDVGVEYHYFRKRLTAHYRLLKIELREPGGSGKTAPGTRI